jgi:hypothetical protein
MALHLVHEGGNFWEVRARPDNIQDFQALAHGALVPLSERQYSIWATGVQGARIAIRAKKALLRCMGVGIHRETWVK